MEFEWAFFGGLFLHTFTFWWIILPAIFLGLIVGAIPGFSAANTIIILLPLTLAMDPEVGLIFMVALYASSRMGAGIPAILVNIPGTAGAAATPLDGYPMTKQGRAHQALAISFVSSVFGGLLTTIIALLTMPWLSQAAFYLHSVEMIVIMLFGISLIATIAARDTLKGLIAGFFGLMIGFIGADVVYETPRGTFGFLELYDKVPLIPALVGLFAVSEAFAVIEGESILTERGRAAMQNAGWKETFEGAREALSRWWHIIWTSLIGLVIGVVPGAGAAIASFVAYQQSRTFSKTPELYGTGHIEGLIAPESSNNGVTAGTLVPLLVIGVPGGATAAIMLVVLQFHGVTVGPDLFMESPEIAYGPFTAMAVTYAIMILTICPLARYMSKITVVSTTYMSPVIIAFTLVGAFVPRQYMFDMYLALTFGVIGYIARKTGYHTAAILIGVILGPLLETYFLRALKMSEGDLMVIFSSDLANVMWVLLVISLFVPYLMQRRRAKAAERAPPSTTDC
ncbi:MAG: tripartite tricarboxylate transporter permease [Alphaproteobacteria bacterium]|nr:tripartite tricarboxylate transporter permease [Alphaproteobacteria bacterium]